MQDTNRDENAEDGHVHTEGGVNWGAGTGTQTPSCVNEIDG